jgi:hypothetical protein
MRLFILLFILFTLSSCGFFFSTITPEFGTKYKNMGGGFGYVTKEDIKAGLELKKKVKEGTTQVTEVSKDLITFGYFPANGSIGMPVKAFQNVFEKFRMVTESQPFLFSEMINDKTSFDGFMVNTQDDKSNHYFEPLYVIADYTPDGIFYSDAKIIYWQFNNTTFGMPINLRYKKEIKDVKYLASLYFHENFPQKEKVISIEIPSWLEVEILEKNFEGYEISKSSKKIVMDDLVKIKNSSGQDNKNNKEKEDKKGANKQDKVKVVTYTMKNLLGLKREPNAVGSSYNLPHIIILCKKLDEKKAKPFAMKEPKEKKVEKTVKKSNDPSEAKRKRQAGIYKTGLINDIGDLYKWYHEIALLTKNDSAYTGVKAREITKNSLSPYEKMEKIFFWVQDNIRYVAFEDGLAAFKPEPCQDVYDNRYGDCKGMANLLTNMLNSVGLDARISWIGTRHLAYDYNIPSVIVDNHMICTVYLDGKKYFLDATEDFIGVGDYAHRIQGRPLLISNGNDYQIDTIPDLGVERNLVSRNANFKIIDDKLVGNVKEVLRGEPKTQLIWTLNNLPGQEKEKALNRYLQESYHYILPDSIKSSSFTDRYADFTIDYLLTLKQNIITKGNSIYVNPDYSYEFKGMLMDSTRVFDLDFSHRINNKVEYSIDIPEGYRVKYIPNKIEIDNTEFYLLVNYIQEGKSIRYTKHLKVKQGLITKKNFVEWNKMLVQLNNSRADWAQFQK